MTDSETIFRVQKQVDEGDREGIIEQFRQHPDLVEAITLGSEIRFLHYAAVEEKPDLVRLFFDLGIPLNTTNEYGECPLSAMVQMGDIDTVKWMLEKGADPNLSPWPMAAAIARGRLDIVKLLVEYGVDVNAVFFSPPTTALSHAVEFNQKEIIQYLRSLHAIMPDGKEMVLDDDSQRADDESEAVDAEVMELDERVQQIEDSVDVHDEIKAYFEYHLDAPPQELGLHEIIPGETSISVWFVEPEDANDPRVIFTSGMSGKPMTVPSGMEAYRFAELLMFLPPDWPVPPDLNDSSQSWPWLWLRTIAHYPHQQGTWLGDSVTSFANDDPPRPLDASCRFSAFLLGTNLGGYRGFTATDGRQINMITAMPIYTEEYAVARRKDGIAELLQRFAARDISASLIPNRPNVG